jgi:hypothetical protein
VRAARGDVELVVDVMARYRSWLAYSELELLHELERQAWSGHGLDEKQRIYVDQLVRRAEDRREMAITLSERERRH